MTSAIYAIRNKTNGRSYVGSAVNLCRRWKYHKNRLRCQKHHSAHLQSAWNLYGEEAFEWVMLENLTARCAGKSKSEIVLILYEREEVWEKKLQSESGCYNVRAIAASNLGVKYSDEAKRKMGAWQVGKKHSEETRAKISAARKGQPSPNKGKTFSAEIRKRMSEGGRGKILSLEHRAKISAAGKEAWKQRRISLT